MPVQVQTPDGNIAEFPDYMSDQQIADVLKRSFPSPYAGHSMSLAQPVNINAPLPMPHGSTPLAPVPHRQPAAPTTPLQAGLQGVDNTLGQGARGVTESVLGTLLHASDLTGSPLVASLASSLMSGQKPDIKSSTLADALSAANTVSRSVGSHTSMTPFQFPQVAGPTTGEQTQAAIPWLQDQPQGISGRSMRTIGNVLPFGAAGLEGGAPSMIANVAGPSAGIIGAGEGARALGGSPDDIALAQMGGGTLGGMLANALAGGPKGSERILANKTPKMTPQQMADVVDSMQTGQNIGLQPTLTESIDANVPGAQTTLTQRGVEGTREGVNVLGPRMAARPAQMQSVIADVLDQIAPQRSPIDTAMSAQQGAETALNDARAGVNAEARPSYDALPGQTMPAADFAALKADPSFAKALKAFRADPELNQAPYKGLPDNNLAVVNEVVKTLRDLKEAVTPNPANQASSQQLAGIRGGSMDRANALASSLSPDYANARQIVAQGHQDVIDPMAAGPLGTIAKPEGMTQPSLASQTGAVFPNQPFAGQPAVTADALQSMGAGGQNVGADLTRAYLERQAAESAQRIAGKPNTFAPSNFSTTVAGNPLQRQNLLGATDAVAPAATKPLADALDTFDVTGMRRGEGSATADNLGQQADISSGGKVAIAEAAHASPRMILDRLSNWYDTLRIEGNQRDLVAAVNANPQEAASILQRIEAARGNTALQRSLLGSLKGLAASQPATQGANQ